MAGQAPAPAPAPMKSLSKSEVTRYAFYAFASMMGVIIPMQYLNIFITDSLLIDAALMGLILLICRVIDFIVCIFAGGLIEKAKLKHGKYVSWIKILKWPVVIGCIISFFDSSSAPLAVRVAQVMIGYLLINPLMNIVATAQYGILASMAGFNMDDRNKLSARGAQYMAAANIICSIAVVPLVTFLTPQLGAALPYTILATIGAIIWFVGFNVLEKVGQPYDNEDRSKLDMSKVSTVSAGDMVKSVFGNSQLLAVIIAYTVFYVGMYIGYTVMAYYFIYVLGDFNLMAVALTATTIFGLFAAIIAPKIGMKVGKKMAMVYGLALYGVMMLCVMFFAKSNLILYIVFSCLGALGMNMFTIFTVNYMLDAGEYGMYKTGKDNRAVAMSMMNVPMKIGLAVGGTIGAFMLAGLNYVPGMAVDANFVNGFMWILAGWPGICYFIASAIMFFFYKITDADAAKYAAANAQKMAEMMGGAPAGAPAEAPADAPAEAPEKQ